MVLISTSEYLTLLAIKLNGLWLMCNQSPNDLGLVKEYQKELKNYNFHKLKSKESIAHELAVNCLNPKSN